MLDVELDRDLLHNSFISRLVSLFIGPTVDLLIGILQHLLLSLFLLCLASALAFIPLLDLSVDYSIEVGQ